MAAREAAKARLDPEAEELAEADAILDDLRERAARGDDDLPWGETLQRSWDGDTLVVTREYEMSACRASDAPADSIAAVRLWIRELPLTKHADWRGGFGAGGVVWPGALVLAEALARRRADVLGETAVSVLELGAGCGLPGLCAAALATAPGAHVVVTDESASVLSNLRTIVAKNVERVGTKLEAAVLKWEELLDAEAASSAPPGSEDDSLEEAALRPGADSVDLLLGSDIVWGDRGALVGRLARLLVRPGGWLLLSAQLGREGLEDLRAELEREDEAASQEVSGPAFDVEVSQEDFRGEAYVVLACRRRALLTHK